MWKSLRKTPLPVLCLVLGVVCPSEFSVYVGSIRLPMHRVAILVFILPAIIRMMRGRAVRLSAYDVLFLLFALWISSVMVMHLGTSDGLQFGGSLALESFGGYVISRAYIRDAVTFRSTVDLLFCAILAVGALALPEATFAHHYVHDWLRAVTGYVQPINEEKRMGILRSYATFDHPILYGSFCASILAMVWMMRGSMLKRFVRTGLIGGATFLGASSAPLLILIIQGAILGWEWGTRGIRHRVSLMLGGLFAIYLLAELVVKRSVITAVVTNITLDPWTAYYRTLIWQYGVQNVMEHPIFGIGLGNWERAAWMGSSSVDNFWLLIPMRTGLPSLVFLLGAIVLFLRAVHGRRARKRSREEQSLAVAWTISFLALSLAALTVHYWNSVHAYFFFFIGMAGWLADPVCSAKPVQPKRVAKRPPPAMRPAGTWQPALPA